MLAIATAAYAYQPVARGTPAAAQQLRHVAPIAQFRSPVGTDQAVVDQQKRAEAAGLSPKQYEEATRRAANDYLAENGAHVMPADDASPPQRAEITAVNSPGGCHRLEGDVPPTQPPVVVREKVAQHEAFLAELCLRANEKHVLVRAEDDLHAEVFLHGTQVLQPSAVGIFRDGRKQGVCIHHTEIIDVGLLQRTRDCLAPTRIECCHGGLVVSARSVHGVHGKRRNGRNAGNLDRAASNDSHCHVRVLLLERRCPERQQPLRLALCCCGRRLLLGS